MMQKVVGGGLNSSPNGIYHLKEDLVYDVFILDINNNVHRDSRSWKRKGAVQPTYVFNGYDGNDASINGNGPGMMMGGPGMMGHGMGMMGGSQNNQWP